MYKKTNNLCCAFYPGNIEKRVRVTPYIKKLLYLCDLFKTPKMAVPIRRTKLRESIIIFCAKTGRIIAKKKENEI